MPAVVDETAVGALLDRAPGTDRRQPRAERRPPQSTTRSAPIVAPFPVSTPVTRGTRACRSVVSPVTATPRRMVTPIDTTNDQARGSVHQVMIDVTEPASTVYMSRA
jgi:hypothetical protein